MSEFTEHEREQPVYAERLLADIEHLAVELARLAGAEIVTALGRLLAVRYKGSVDDPKLAWRNPVSEVDQRIEKLIRTRVSERFPDHDVLGEEIDEGTDGRGDFIWAVDPIDGTANFINGFPLFASSVGVLHRGRPIAGALWCATSHALRYGVYHARAGGPLCFDEQPIEPQLNPAVRRRLAGEPYVAATSDDPWEVRKTGSAGIECAFVAAGLLRVARFERPNIWDVAAGMVLIEAAGGSAQLLGDDGWAPFERFEAPRTSRTGRSMLRNWSRPLILGEREAVALLCRQHVH